MGKTVTISFGNVAENTYGQEKIGQEGCQDLIIKIKTSSEICKEKIWL